MTTPGNRRTATETLAVTLGLLLGLAACQRPASGPGPAPATTGGAASAAPSRPPLATRKVPVLVAAAEQRAVTYTIDTVGSLRPNEVIRVPARVAGVLQDIAFSEGAEVTPRTVLARVDPERYRLNLERAEAAVREAAARLAVAKAQLDKREQLRARDPGWVTDEELSNFAARVDEEQASLEAVKSARALARKDFEDSVVRAEKAGVIDKKLADTGQYVTAGFAIASIVDVRRLKLAFTVAETESARLGPAPEIRFRVKAMPAKEFTATLYHVGQGADPETRMVECLAWVEAPGRELRPGFFADVTIAAGAERQSLVVPQTAVLPTERGFRAFVLKGEDEVEARTLRLGLYTRDGLVEVLDGLAPGERVVVRGAASLNPSSRVEVTAAVETAR